MFTNLTVTAPLDAARMAETSDAFEEPLVAVSAALVTLPVIVPTLSLSPLVPSASTRALISLDEPVTVVMLAAVTRPVVPPLTLLNAVAAMEPESESVTATSAFMSILLPLNPSLVTSSSVASLAVPLVAVTAVAVTRPEVAASIDLRLARVTDESVMVMAASVMLPVIVPRLILLPVVPSASVTALFCAAVPVMAVIPLATTIPVVAVSTAFNAVAAMEPTSVTVADRSADVCILLPDVPWFVTIVVVIAAAVPLMVVAAVAMTSPDVSVSMVLRSAAVTVPASLTVTLPVIAGRDFTTTAAPLNVMLPTTREVVTAVFNTETAVPVVGVNR